LRAGYTGCGTDSLLTTSVNPVEFDKTDAGGIVFAAQDRHPVSLDQGRENGRLAIVSWRQSRRLNRSLLRLFPIIVSELVIVSCRTRGNTSFRLL
jgi:hypothetical protein